MTIAAEPLAAGVHLACGPRGHHVSGPRLLLRPLRPGDVTDVAAAAADPEALHHLGFTHADRTWLLRRVRAMVDAVDLSGSMYAQYAIVDRVSSKVVGTRTLVAQGDGLVVTGSWLHADVRGRGYGREALALLLHLAHDHLGIPVVVAGTSWDNAAALKQLASVGMVPYEHHAPFAAEDGRLIPTVWFAHAAEASRCCPLLDPPSTAAGGLRRRFRRPVC